MIAEGGDLDTVCSHHLEDGHPFGGLKLIAINHDFEHFRNFLSFTVSLLKKEGFSF